MSVSPQPNPKHLQWQMECYGHSIIERLTGMLPGRWVFRLGELLGGLAWYFMPKRRNLIRRNLRIACAGEMSASEIEQLARNSFRRSGANLISAAHTARLRPEQLARVIDLENLDLLESALTTGKGVVILLAHMGNWELLSRLVHLFPTGCHAGAFYRPLNNLLLDARILKRRQADGTRMFSKRDPFHQVTGFLRDGGIVGILADQRVGMQGEVVPFFGRLTRSSPLPSLLARRAKSEVLALSLVTSGPGKWRARFLSVEAPYTIESCARTLETAMKSGLIDVFWLQERWKVYANAHQTFCDWLDGTDRLSQKRHRALLWLNDAPPEWQIPTGWLHPDLNYDVVLSFGKQRPAWLPADVHILTRSPKTALLDELRTWEQSTALPYDFILAPAISSAFGEAARKLSIPVITLL